MTTFLNTLRSLVRAPGFTVSVVAVLGLAIGANAATFTLVDQVIFRPLPVANPAEVVAISAPPLPRQFGPSVMTGRPAGSGGGKQSLYGISYPTFIAFRERMPMFSDMLAFSGFRANLLAGDQPVEVRGVLVTLNYFDALGIRPALGRFLHPDDERVTGGTATAVLSHGFWQRQFGGDPAVLNRIIRLDDASVMVVGVAPPGFTGTVSGMRVDMFVPLRMADQLAGVRGFRWDSPSLNTLSVMARLAPGESRESAGKAAEAVYQLMVAESLKNWTRMTARDRELIAASHLAVLPAGLAGSQQAGAARTLNTVLSLLMAMVAVVLLVAAGNIANLCVARGSARARTTAIHLALGATRWHLLRASLVESLVLALASGAAGYLLSSWLTQLIPTVLGLAEMPPGVSGVPDWRVAAFTVTVATATGVLIWIVSAIQLTRQANLPTLSGLRPAVRFWGLGLRRALVFAQLTLSVALLCGSAVLTRSLVTLMSVDPGFDVDGIVTFDVTPAGKAYDAVRTHALAAALTDGARRLPGVVAASVTSQLPLAGGSSQTWVIGDIPARSAANPPLTNIAEVGAGYFGTLRLDLAAGREFSAEDRAGGPKVAILSESLAGQLFGDRPAVGRRVAFSLADGTDSAVSRANEHAIFDIEVVGVARDARSRSLRSAPLATMYLPQSQATRVGRLSLVLRTSAAAPTIRDVQALVRGVDPALPVSDFRTLREVVVAGTGRERLLAAFSSAFGALSAALSAIGVLGLTGYAVTRRTREIGVRLALGATRSRVMSIVMREVLVLAGAGSIAGTAVYVGVSRYLQSALFELSPNDPVTILGAVGVLIAVALAAGAAPAYRAARVDPAVTLRTE